MSPGAINGFATCTFDFEKYYKTLKFVKILENIVAIDNSALFFIFGNFS